MVSKLVKSIAILALGLTVAASASAATKSQSLLREINRARAAHGLRPLRVERTLAAVARRHSVRMARTRVLVHSAPLFLPAGATRVGENLARVPGDRAEDVVAAWLASPAHRANLLNGRFTTIGLGDAGGFVTADFAGN